MCVIADESGVLGLGGVIGGEETGSTDATTNVFIESAYFDPKRTARTGRKLNIQSDARFQIRARRRSGLRGTRPRACLGARARHLRRDPKQGRDRRQAAEAERALRLRSEARQALEWSRPQRRRDQKAAQRAWHRAERRGVEAQGSAAVMAPRHFRACRSRRGGGAARRRRSGSGDADAARGRRGAPGADRDAVADAARAPRARRTWPGRGRHLVVHPA